MNALDQATSAAALYGGLMLLLLIVLQVRVIRLRAVKRVGIGDGGDPELARAIRVHGNFVETAGFGLIALVLLALSTVAAWVIHVVGLLLLVGRIAHAVGLSGTAGTSVGRAAGVLLTNLALFIAAIVMILEALI